MNKGIFKILGVTLVCVFLMTSCFSYTAIVGEGAKGNKTVKKWNHYVIYGLAPVGVSDSQEMAGGAKDYEITVEQTFINGLIAALTWGIYTPTTTTVKK